MIRCRRVAPIAPRIAITLLDLSIARCGAGLTLSEEPPDPISPSVTGRCTACLMSHRRSRAGTRTRTRTRTRKPTRLSNLPTYYLISTSDRRKELRASTDISFGYPSPKVCWGLEHLRMQCILISNLDRRSIHLALIVALVACELFLLFAFCFFPMLWSSAWFRNFESSNHSISDEGG